MRRELIFEILSDCARGCRWELWVEGDAWRIGAACDECQSDIEKMIREAQPGLPVTYVK